MRDLDKIVVVEVRRLSPVLLLRRVLDGIVDDPIVRAQVRIIVLLGVHASVLIAQRLREVRVYRLVGVAHVVKPRPVDHEGVLDACARQLDRRRRRRLGMHRLLVPGQALLLGSGSLILYLC